MYFLRDWLKDKEYVALAYMMGILPIKKTGTQSGLNMFDEYSMVWQGDFAPYTGFTDEEVKDLCRQYGRDFNAMKDRYGSYLLSNAGSIYNPLSIVKAVSYGWLLNYWNNTESYESLAEYIQMDYDGLKEAVAVLMNGGRVEVNTSSFQNDFTTFRDKDDILTLLIHLGYLGYDSETREAFIPNKEVLDVYKAAAKSDCKRHACRIEKA